jgi:hypothetical protein
MALGKYVIGSLAIGAGYFALPAGQSDTIVKLAQPAPIATERLHAGHRVVEGTGLGSLTIESNGADHGALLISVRKAGDPHSVKCRVTVSLVSPGESRADIDCNQPDIKDAPMRRLGSQALGIVVREHVAATVGERPYDTDRVADRMIALVAMNGPAIAASMSPPREAR